MCSVPQVTSENGSLSGAVSNDVQPGDIRYNLMAVVPDRRVALKNKMTILRTNMLTIHETVDDLVSRSRREACGEEMKMELMSPLASPATLDAAGPDETEVPFSALREQVEKIKVRLQPRCGVLK